MRSEGMFIKEEDLQNALEARNSAILGGVVRR